MKKTLFLDRDGTLIVEKNFLCDPADVVLIPQAGETLAVLQTDGWQFVIVTNQSGIGRGLYTTEAMDSVHVEIDRQLASHNVQISGWYHSPSHPETADWMRKPEVGMAIAATRDLDVDLRFAVMVGDKISDIDMGKRAGIETVLVRTGYGASLPDTQATIEVDTIAQLTPGILNQMIPSKLASQIENHFKEAEETLASFRTTSASQIHSAAVMVASAFQSGHKVLLCGNGGSAADAQHIAAELVCRLTANRERKALPAIALTTDTSILTAYANDYDFNGVFARQVEALGQAGDILIAISTSGNSTNVVLAAEAAKATGMQVLSFTGNTGRLGLISDVTVSIPGATTMRVQECHLMAYHIMCDLIETLMFD